MQLRSIPCEGVFQTRNFVSTQTSLWANPPRHIVDDGLDVFYEPEFIDYADSKSLLSKLLEEANWHRPILHFGGAAMPTRRQVAWHADKGYVYQYSGQEHTASDWTPAMLEIRSHVQTYMGRGFNSVLLNLYENGNDYVSFHADDEEDMADDVPIVAVSLGATRDFVFKHENGSRYNLALESGSLVIMQGDTQKVAKHSIPKRAGVSEPRISLTFRQCIRKI